MQLIRVKNPRVFEFIPIGKLSSDPLISEESVIKSMIIQMGAFPDDTFVLAAVKNKVVTDFMFAYIPEDKKYCWIQVAFSTTKQTTKKAMIFLEWFCKSKGIEEIRMETQRNPLAFERSYNFKMHSIIMSRKVT